MLIDLDRIGTKKAGGALAHCRKHGTQLWGVSTKDGLRVTCYYTPPDQTPKVVTADLTQLSPDAIEDLLSAVASRASH